MRRKVIDANYRPFKYHLLWIVRNVIGGAQPRPLNSNKFEKYCDLLVKTLRDEKQCLAAFKESCEVLDTILAGDFGRDKAKDVSIHSTADFLLISKLDGKQS